MCARYLTMKQLREEHEEWFRPSNILQGKKALTSTKRELLERVHTLEAENGELQEKVRDLEQHKRLLAGYAESTHTCSQCQAKFDDLCPPKDEDRLRNSMLCINALIRWAEITIQRDKERTEKFPWEV